MNLIINAHYTRTRVLPSHPHSPKQIPSQFRGKDSTPPPNKPAKPEWLKKVAIVGALMGGGLTTYGVVNNTTSKSLPPAPQVQTEKAAPQRIQTTPLTPQKILSSRKIQDNRTYHAEFTGSRTIPLATCSADGQDVTGQFYIIWEKDLLTTNADDREAQLRLILNQLPQEKIKPEWKAPGVYLVASQKPEGVITYAKDIVEAYQNHIIDTVIQYELSQRFNDFFGKRQLSEIDDNLQPLLFQFENESGKTTITGFMNNQGLTPTLIGFNKIQTGSKHYKIQKVVTTQMEVNPVMPMPMPPSNTSHLEKDKGEPTLADPLPPPPSMPEPIPDPSV